MNDGADDRPVWAVRIRDERQARSWSVARAAGYLRQRDRYMPEQTALAKYWSQRWESGRVKPSDRYRHHLCALLGLPVSIFDEADTPVPGVPCRVPPTEPTVKDELSRLSGEELIVMAANESARYAREHGPSNVHPMTIDQLQDDVLSLAQDLVSDDPIPVVLRSRKLRDDVFSLVEGHQQPAHTKTLYSVAGWSCGFLAVASSDFFGRYDAASAQCRTAWLCAEMSEDNALRAWIRTLQSGVAFWAGKWSQAARLAAQARQYAITGPAVKRAVTAEARAWARLGNPTAVDEAIRASEAALDLPDGENDIGAMGFTEPNRIRCAGTATLWLGEHQTARRYLSEALTAYEHQEPDAYAHIAVTRADLASAHLHCGDIDAASEVLAPLLSLPPHRRLAGTARRTIDLRTQLTHPGYRTSPRAHDLADQIEQFHVDITTLNIEE